jgi:hypothetical protein
MRIQSFQCRVIGSGHYQKKGLSKAAAEHSFAKRAFTQAQAKVLLAKLCSAALLDTLESKGAIQGN